MWNLLWNLLMNYLVICLIVIFSPLLAASLFYGIGYGVLERFVDPVFDFRVKRISELTFGFFIVSMIMSMYLEVISGHFHIPITNLPDSVRLAIPGLILVVIRCIVKFHSSRIARDHLNVVMFIMLVSSAATLAIYLSGNSGEIEFHPPNIYFFFHLFALSLVVPITTDVVLVLAKKIYFVRRFIFKDKKLIDLTEELPITFKFVSRKEKIDEKIREIIRGDKNRKLFILTKSYSTVINNIDDIVARCRDGNVRIIGAPAENQETQKRLDLIEKRGLLVCQESFDDIRVVIDGDHRLMASFATSGNKGSHVGVYTEHPFIISLFKGYCETKCGKNELCLKACSDHVCVKNN